MCRTNFPPKDRLRMIVHGVEMPDSTPLVQTWLKMSHADFFLYIVITESPNDSDILKM